MKVGDKIYLKAIANAARYGPKTVEATITKVGRKYFQVEHYGRFYIETLKQDRGDFMADWVAYKSMQEIENEALLHKLSQEVESGIKSKRLTLNQLKRIKYIIDETAHPGV